MAPLSPPPPPLAVPLSRRASTLPRTKPGMCVRCLG